MHFFCKTVFSRIISEACQDPFGEIFKRHGLEPELKESRLSKESIMLVLSRKVGERIWIGEDISITVVRITGGGVRLGIEAPSEMPVVREELKLKLEQDQSDVEVDIVDNSSPQESV